MQFVQRHVGGGRHQEIEVGYGSVHSLNFTDVVVIACALMHLSVPFVGLLSLLLCSTNVLGADSVLPAIVRNAHGRADTSTGKRYQVSRISD